MFNQPPHRPIANSFFAKSSIISLTFTLLLIQLSVVVASKSEDRMLIQITNDNENIWLRTRERPLIIQQTLTSTQESHQDTPSSSSESQNSDQPKPTANRDVGHTQHQTSSPRVNQINEKQEQFKKWLNKNNLLVDPYAFSSQTNKPLQTPKPKIELTQALIKPKNPVTQNKPKTGYTVDIDALLDKSRAPINYHMIRPQQIKNAREWKKMVENVDETVTDIQIQEIMYYEEKYKTGSYQEIPFCIVVPTYNNAEGERYLKNMKSIVMQNYSNFHIVVFDDASTDKTGDLIQEFLESQTKVPKERYHIERNEQQMRAMYNLRRAALEFCKPQEVFLIVDGDDELLGRQVLKLFSASFQKEDAWFVYSNFLMGRNSNVGYSRPFPEGTIQRNTYRYYPFVTSHLRAFYTQLFRNIREQDLLDENGHYFKAANDVAICIPCLQQSHKKVNYIPQLTYYYNSDTGQNNHYLRAMQQRNNDRKIRRKLHYKPLEKLFPDS